MDLTTILVIVSGVLTLAAAILGTKFTKVKQKLVELKDVFKEGVDVITVAVQAVNDNTITSEEAEAIKKEALEAVAAFKKLIGKA